LSRQKRKGGREDGKGQRWLIGSADREHAAHISADSQVLKKAKKTGKERKKRLVPCEKKKGRSRKEGRETDKKEGEKKKNHPSCSKGGALPSTRSTPNKGEKTRRANRPRPEGKGEENGSKKA